MPSNHGTVRLRTLRGRFAIELEFGNVCVIAEQIGGETLAIGDRVFALFTQPGRVVAQNDTTRREVVLYLDFRGSTPRSVERILDED